MDTVAASIKSGNSKVAAGGETGRSQDKQGTKKLLWYPVPSGLFDKARGAFGHHHLFLLLYLLLGPDTDWRHQLNLFYKVSFYSATYCANKECRLQSGLGCTAIIRFTVF